MSSFEVMVRRIDAVEDHPDADRLSIVTILGYNAITAKVPDPSVQEGEARYVHRHKAGDLIVYVPEGAIVPERLLKWFGYWNDEKGHGMLSGNGYDRVKIVRLRGIHSQGLVWPLLKGVSFDTHPSWFLDGDDNWDIFDGGDRDIKVTEGMDVADIYGITKYEPPIPGAMQGECKGLVEYALNYDFESVQRCPNFFVEGEEVEFTEKLHGTFTRISYRRNSPEENLFGNDNNIAVASKGLGKQGIVFFDSEQNRLSNVYVKAAIGNNLIDVIQQIANDNEADSVDIFGETFGTGIQKLTYGRSTPAFRAFDIRINGEFQDAHQKAHICNYFGIERVPVLYRGPYNNEVMIYYRDGTTTIEGANHIREGIVITATGDQTLRGRTGTGRRPILKAVSPAYLLKEDGSEIQ